MDSNSTNKNSSLRTETLEVKVATDQSLVLLLSYSPHVESISQESN